ncbi:MAG: glycosyltransferase family 2 protein [Bacteroidetes bacterium]|nr:glycosyltransferase family 2 protein [Bacteroidota bacterium]
MKKLSVIIITYNEEHNIVRCLESVKPFADEVIVVDSYSTDKTVEICKSFGCKVLKHEFLGYSKQKQLAVDAAENDWIFWIDADEQVSTDLATEILHLKEVQQQDIAGYSIPRTFVYLGRVMKYSSGSKEMLLRIFDRKKSHFTDVTVHEEVKVKGKTLNLKNKLFHYSYRDLSHHLQKIDKYTTQAAEGYLKQGKRFSKCWVIFKFPISFCTFYFLRLGFLDGYPGFVNAFLAAFYGSMKVAKTIEGR